MTKLDYDLRYVDFSQLQQFMGRRIYSTNRGRYGAAFAGVVLCALLITFAIVVNLYGSRHFQIFGAPYPRSTLILLILTLLGAVLSLIPAVKLRLSILRSQVSDKGPLLGATSLSVEEDGITVGKSLVTTKYKWGAFQAVEIVKGAVILPIDSGMGIIIPGAAFNNDAQRYAFVAEISQADRYGEGNSRVNLVFDSVAVFDEKTDSVKFAGRFTDARGVERFAVCRVSREFLTALCDLADASPELLQQAYVSVRDEVNGIAARQFAAGQQKPLIDLEHYMREHSRLNASKAKKGM